MEQMDLLEYLLRAIERIDRMYTIEEIVENDDLLLVMYVEIFSMMFVKKIQRTTVENRNHNEKMMHRNTSLDQEEILIVDIDNYCNV